MARSAKATKKKQPQTLDEELKSISEDMERAGCKGALSYVPELTWILLLRFLDQHEQQEAEAAEAVGASFTPTLEQPYRWHDWAAPYSEDSILVRDGLAQGWKRKEFQEGKTDAFLPFVNGRLLTYLKKLRNQPNATDRQKVISEVFSNIDRTRIDTERNLLDILDQVHAISPQSVDDDTLVHTLSRAYEKLLFKMGAEITDKRKLFTPRVVIKAMIQAIQPQIDETIYDASCGSGGFLVEAYKYMVGENQCNITNSEQLQTLKHQTFYGREQASEIYPIALANLIFNGIDEPHIWHGNTLTGGETYGGLFTNAPALYNVALMNPPFGGKEGKDAQTNFAYKTGSTQILFLQHVLNSLKPNGRCGIVLDEGVLFQTDETAFVQTKKKLLDDADVWCIVSLPGGVFTTGSGGVKANLAFFTKGKPTEQIWYYDLSDLKVTKKTPLTLDHFRDFFQLLPSRGLSDRSWIVTREDIEAKNYDLKAVNPNAKNQEDTRTPQQLLETIRIKSREVQEALAVLEQGT